MNEGGQMSIIDLPELPEESHLISMNLVDELLQGIGQLKERRWLPIKSVNREDFFLSLVLFVTSRVTCTTRSIRLGARPW